HAADIGDRSVERAEESLLERLKVLRVHQTRETARVAVLDRARDVRPDARLLDALERRVRVLPLSAQGRDALRDDAGDDRPDEERQHEYGAPFVHLTNVHLTSAHLTSSTFPPTSVSANVPSPCEPTRTGIRWSSPRAPCRPRSPRSEGSSELDGPRMKSMVHASEKVQASGD